MSIIPANQTCSWMVYNMAIANACNLSHAFVASQRARIARAYDNGEPVWMIVDELKLVHSIKPARREKTPLELANMWAAQRMVQP